MNDFEDMDYTEEDLGMEEMIEMAWEISENEGRPFDHIMGELLGGIR